MPPKFPGPISAEQLRRLSTMWKQGEHILISGPTGSGKSTLARQLAEIRLRRGGAVIVFVMKILPDETILKEYKGWTRWTRMKRKPNVTERRILLQPDFSRAKTMKEKLAIQRAIFSEALDIISEKGKWTVINDEGLWLCDPKYLGLATEWAMMHAVVGRAGKNSNITLIQRPSEVPLILYGSAAHAFAGKTTEDVDAKRLSKLGGWNSKNDLLELISNQNIVDYQWIQARSANPPELFNLAK